MLEIAWSSVTPPTCSTRRSGLALAASETTPLTASAAATAASEVTSSSVGRARSTRMSAALPSSEMTGSETPAAADRAVKSLRRSVSAGEVASSVAPSRASTSTDSVSGSPKSDRARAFSAGADAPMAESLSSISLKPTAPLPTTVAATKAIQMRRAVHRWLALHRATATIGPRGSRAGGRGSSSRLGTTTTRVSLTGLSPWETGAAPRRAAGNSWRSTHSSSHALAPIGDSPEIRVGLAP